jgi:pSer/pThr/pTyr-binding forkhead associated (FHA) protein/ribosomal protein L37E
MPRSRGLKVSRATKRLRSGARPAWTDDGEDDAEDQPGHANQVSAEPLHGEVRSETVTACARCGRDNPITAAECANCGEPNAAALAFSGAQQGYGEALAAPLPLAFDDAVTPGAPALAGETSSRGADWDADWPLSQPEFQPDAQAELQPDAEPELHSQSISLVGGHLTLSSATTSGELGGELGGELYEFELAGSDIIIGRSPGCDISLADDPLASRRHVMLSYDHESGGYAIADLGSSNGTYLNGVEVRDETELHDGDIITVGRHTLTVSATPSRVAATPIDARATGPVAILPSEATDPNLQTVGAEPTAAEVVIELTESSWEEDAFAPPADTGVGSPLLQKGSMRDESAPLDGADGALGAEFAADATAGIAHRHDLDALQTQLTELIGSLRQQATADAAQQERVRRALVDVRDTLEVALATQLEPGAQAFSVRVDTLAALSRKTAENPRHLDYVLSLAERAEELVIVLEAVEKLQADGGPLTHLQDLFRRVQSELD